MRANRLGMHFDKSQSIPNLLALIEDLVEEKP